MFNMMLTAVTQRLCVCCREQTSRFLMWSEPTLGTAMQWDRDLLPLSDRSVRDCGWQDRDGQWQSDSDRLRPLSLTFICNSEQVSERLWLMRVETEMGNDRVNQTAWDLIPLYATGQWEIVDNESWDRDGQWQSESDRPRLLSLTFSDRSARDCGYWDGQLQSESDRWNPLTFIVYWTGQREIIIMADKVR